MNLELVFLIWFCFLFIGFLLLILIELFESFFWNIFLVLFLGWVVESFGFFFCEVKGLMFGVGLFWDFWSVFLIVFLRLGVYGILGKIRFIFGNFLGGWWYNFSFFLIGDVELDFLLVFLLFFLCCIVFLVL